MMEHISDPSSEGNKQNFILSIMENKKKDSQTLEFAMDEAPSSQSSVSTDASSLRDCVGSLTLLLPSDLHNESNGEEENDDKCEEPSTSVKSVHAHEMEGKIEPHKGYESRICAPSGYTTLQDHSMEANLLSCKLVAGNSSDNAGISSFHHQEETQIEQSILSSGTCIIDAIDGEKGGDQLGCFSGSENTRVWCEAKLSKDVDGSMNSDFVVESHISGLEVRTLGDDEITKTTSSDSIVEEASSEAHAGNKKYLLTAVSSNTSSSEEKGSQFFDSGSLTAVMEPEVIHDQDLKQVATSETVCLASQELLSEPVQEIEKECNVGYTDCASDGSGASESIYNCQDTKVSLDDYVAKNVDKSSDSLVQSEIRSIADAEESTEPITRDECSVSDKNSLDQKCLPGLNKDLILEDHIFSINSGSGVAVCKESIDDGASYEDEDHVSVNMSLSVSSPMTSQMRLMDTNAECNIDHTNVGVHFEGKTPSQTEGGAASSDCQHHGCTVDKDGGSSMDSTAGTGLQQSDGCAPVEDEEASSTGGEDSASSPACIQPLRQQRKKININHLFVREIVKIQHDREQYDREQVERQIQAQQAATLPQAGCKSSDIKEQRTTFSETRDIRGQTNKQKGLKDVAVHKQVKDSQQMHSTKNKKSLMIQSRNESSYQWNSPQESNEQSRQAFSHAMGGKEHGKIGGGKQLRSMSIYRPPVVRESLVAEHRNSGEPETSNHQSGAFAMSSSPDNSASSFTESCVPVAGSPHIMERPIKVVRSSSGEGFADSLETRADHSAPGMGIKVTFDTEKRQRHIQISEGADSFSKGEQASPAVSHSGSGYRVNKDSKFNRSSRQTFQDSKLSSESRQQVDYGETPSKGNDRHRSQAARSVNPSIFSSGSRQIDHGERPSKGNDRHFVQAARSANNSHRHPSQDSKFSLGRRQTDQGETPSKGNDRHFMQAARGGSLQGFPSAEPSQTRARAGKAPDKSTEKRSSFFERADNGANLHNLSSWLQKSPPPLVRHGSDGQAISNNSTKHSDWYAGTPSPSSQQFSTPSCQSTALLGPSFEGGFFGSTSFASANVRNEEFERTAINIQGGLQHQQFSTPRPHGGNSRYAVTTDSNRGKRDSHKNSTKEFSSPFQAMMKDMSRPQAVFSLPAQRSVDANQDSRGFGMSWHAKDHLQIHGQENLQESLKRSQSDASKKGFTQNSQAQLTPPSRDSFFCTMPMQEKWGDIVDDLTDSYDYLQIKNDGERETQSRSLPHRASNQSSAGFIDAYVSKPVLRASKQDRGMPKYSFKEIDTSQKHTELVREHSGYETPVRKSVFERLGPQNNFQGSILGPPPKMLDSRGVLKASPDALIGSVPPVGTFRNFDSGFYGSQWASQLPSVQHQSADDEGREVVVQAYTEVKQRRSKRELYVPRRGS